MRPSEWAWCWWEKNGWLKFTDVWAGVVHWDAGSLFPLEDMFVTCAPFWKKKQPWLTVSGMRLNLERTERLKRRDNPWSYSKCTFSKSRSAAWEGQCLTSYRARGSDIKFSFPNTLDKLMIEVKTVFLHMKSEHNGGQTFEIWMMELISYHLISHFFGPLYFQGNILRFDLSM